MNVVIQLFLFDFSRCTHSVERTLKEHRLQEYCQTLRINLADSHIKSIHVLCENEEAHQYFNDIVQNSSKVFFEVVGHQPTYKEIMEYVRKTFLTKEIVCIMNGDIFFNSELDHILIQTHLQKNHLFALTRHELTDKGHTIHTLETCPFTGNGGSSDTFIFYTPLPETLDISRMDFRQNLFGAEAVFEKFWVDAGYELWNPCDDIITLHLHHNRIHFEQYDKINTPENSAANWKTSLPPL